MVEDMAAMTKRAESYLYSQISAVSQEIGELARA
jgi:hypothetical protein